MILLPEMIAPINIQPYPKIGGTYLFPMRSMEEHDTSGDEPADSLRRVAARAAIEKLQQATFVKAAENSHHAPTTAVKSQFSQKHAVFGAHLASRSTSAPAGSVVVGAVHKYPTLNVLLRGRVLMVSEHGVRLLVAPCMYMQDAGTKKASWVLEDCELANVVMTPEASENQDQADQIVRGFHTVPSYSDLLEITKEASCQLS